MRTQDNASSSRRLYTDYDFSFFTAYVGTYADPQLAVYWSKNIIKGVPFSNASHYANPEMDKLLEANPLELPRALLESEIREMQVDALRRAGVQNPRQLPPREPFEQNARRRVALGLLLNEVIWRNVRGAGSAMPSPVRRAWVFANDPDDAK